MVSLFLGLVREAARPLILRLALALHSSPILALRLPATPLHLDPNSADRSAIATHFSIF